MNGRFASAIAETNEVTGFVDVLRAGHREVTEMIQFHIANADGNRITNAARLAAARGWEGHNGTVNRI